MAAKATTPARVSHIAGWTLPSHAPNRSARDGGVAVGSSGTPPASSTSTSSTIESAWPFVAAGSAGRATTSSLIGPRCYDWAGGSGGAGVPGRSSGTSADRTPLTKRPLSSVEKRLASSTASSMHDGDGHVGALEPARRPPRRSTLRSSTGMRASVQPVAVLGDRRVERVAMVADAARRAVGGQLVGLERPGGSSASTAEMPFELRPRRAGSSARSRASERSVGRPSSRRRAAQTRVM